MANLENLTPFAATAIPTMAVDGSELLLIVAAGRYLLPRPGSASSDPPRLCDEQPPVPLEDVYWAPFEASSLRREGQTSPARPGTDVLLEGQAWTPQGRPAARVDVALIIPGRIKKSVAVFGERVWTQGIGGLTPTSPRRFISMPLVYERAFGGAERSDAPVREFEPQNPVGRGFFTRESQALEQPLPNLEDPYDLIRSPRDRPRPMSFGPIARSWQPRVGYGGTYDQKWIDQQAPRWPRDLDLRFFHGAPPDQAVRPHLLGGETVAVSGVAPDGAIQFLVPRERLQVKTLFPTNATWQRLTLDALLIEPNSAAFTVIWRAGIPLPGGPLDHDHSVLRTLFEWEE
jgi:hypothetical protein